MIQLKGHASTPDLLKFITSAAGNIDAVANYIGANRTTLAANLADRAAANIASAATTTLLTGPAASDFYGVQFATWRNKHASIVNDVTVVHRDGAGAVDYELHKDTLQPGECLQYHMGVGFVKLAAAGTGFGDILERRIDADQTGTNVATAQQWFPTNGAVAVEAGVTYDMEGLLNLTRSAGTTSHTTGLLFAGSATLTHILWNALTNNSDSEATATAQMTTARVATNTAVKGASTSATEAFSIRVTGTVKINAAGTFIPQFIYSAAPGGAPTIRTGSYFMLTKRGTSYSSKGTWT